MCVLCLACMDPYLDVETDFEPNDSFKCFLEAGMALLAAFRDLRRVTDVGGPLSRIWLSAPVKLSDNPLKLCVT